MGWISRLTLDVCVGEVVFADVRQQRVLVASELAAVVALVCGLCRDCHGLAALAVRVGNVEVVDVEVRRVRTQRRRQVVAQVEGLAEARREGHSVGLVGAVVLRVAVDVDRPSVLGHEDLFRVDAGPDEDVLRGGRVGQGVDSLLDGLELAIRAAYSDGSFRRCRQSKR